MNGSRVGPGESPAAGSVRGIGRPRAPAAVSAGSAPGVRVRRGASALAYVRRSAARRSTTPGRRPAGDAGPRAGSCGAARRPALGPAAARRVALPSRPLPANWPRRAERTDRPPRFTRRRGRRRTRRRHRRAPGDRAQPAAPTGRSARQTAAAAVRLVANTVSPVAASSNWPTSPAASNSARSCRAPTPAACPSGGRPASRPAAGRSPRYPGRRRWPTGRDEARRDRRGQRGTPREGSSNMRTATSWPGGSCRIRAVR